MYLKRLFNFFIPFTFFFSLMEITTLTYPVSAETIKIADVKAQNNATSITVHRGLSTGISFRNGETIDFVLLSDQSRNTYILNAPIDSGRAKTIFIRQNEKITFPNATTATKPNLFVITVDREGNQKAYDFTIQNSPNSGEDRLLLIEPSKIVNSLQNNQINTPLGEASPDDLWLGLDIALDKGYLDPKDPIIFMVAETIALLEQENRTLESILSTTQVPLSLLVKIGRDGLIENTRRRMIPLKPLERDTKKTTTSSSQ